jgi:hypothetical protein
MSPSMDHKNHTYPQLFSLMGHLSSILETRVFKKVQIYFGFLKIINIFLSFELFWCGDFKNNFLKKKNLF